VTNQVTVQRFVYFSAPMTNVALLVLIPALLYDWAIWRPICAPLLVVLITRRPNHSSQPAVLPRYYFGLLVRITG
jgi:hypothetical protein